MRFIFVSFSQSVFPEILYTAKGLEILGHRIVYWLGSSEPTSFIDENGHSGLIDNDFLLSLSNQTVLDVEDLALLSDKEPQIFDFLQRIYPRCVLPELERQYHLLLRYCKWLVENTKPDVIVFRTPPNLPPVHFILYSLAHARGIKTIIFCDTWVSQRVTAMNDFAVGVPLLRHITNDQSPISVSDLRDDLQDYYNMQTQKIKESTPIYFQQILRSYNFVGRAIAGLKALKRVWRLNLLKRLWRTLARHVITWVRSHLSNELPRTYKHLSSQVDLGKPFIYFPLHFQPEFSTNPLGGFFRSQLLVLEILVASLPKDWLIYVKEHPTQWPMGGSKYSPYRHKDYYSSMARFPAVCLIPIETDSFQLIRQAKAVATISGTAGWEAILRGKPALIFGYPWYQHAPEVFRVTDIPSCSSALKKIKDNYTPNSREVLRFLKRLDETSFRGCLDLGYRVNPKYFTVTPEEQGEGMLRSILRLI